MERALGARPELARENARYLASLSEETKLEQRIPPWHKFEEENKANHDAFERLFTTWEASEAKLRGQVLDFLIELKESPTMESHEEFVAYRDRIRAIFRVVERRLPRGDPHRRLYDGA